MQQRIRCLEVAYDTSIAYLPFVKHIHGSLVFIFYCIGSFSGSSNLIFLPCVSFFFETFPSCISLRDSEKNKPFRHIRKATLCTLIPGKNNIPLLESVSTLAKCFFICLHKPIVPFLPEGSVSFSFCSLLL